MASQARKGGVSLPERRNPKKDDDGVFARISQPQIVAGGKQATSDAAFVAKKLLKSTDKAAWIFGTSFLILVVPLIIKMDRKQQLSDLELQQANILGSSSQVKSDRAGSEYSRLTKSIVGWELKIVVIKFGQQMHK